MAWVFVVVIQTVWRILYGMSSLVRLLHGLLALLQRMGWAYLLALAVAVLALYGFAELTEEVLEGEFQSLNEGVLLALHAARQAWLDRLALALSRLGGASGTTFVSGAAILFWIARRRFLDAAGLLVVIGGGALLIPLLKNWFQMPRPDLFVSLAPESTFSFPSGHATISVCLYGYLAAITVMESPRKIWRWCAALLFAGVALGIIWSRLYLGVHWLTDVMAGTLVALFWVSVSLALKRTFQA